MDTLPQTAPVGYAFGVSKAHTAGRCPPAYTPLAKIACPVCESTDCLCAPERWTAEERAEWAAAELRDAARENGGGW